MRPQATGVWGLKLRVSEASSYGWLNILTDAAVCVCCWCVTHTPLYLLTFWHSVVCVHVGRVSSGPTVLVSKVLIFFPPQILPTPFFLFFKKILFYGLTVDVPNDATCLFFFPTRPPLSRTLSLALCLSLSFALRLSLSLALCLSLSICARNSVSLPRTRLPLCWCVYLDYSPISICYFIFNPFFFLDIRPHLCFLLSSSISAYYLRVYRGGYPPSSARGWVGGCGLVGACWTEFRVSCNASLLDLVLLIY